MGSIPVGDIFVADKYGRVLDDLAGPVGPTQEFRKKSAPITGNAFGDWTNRDLSYLRLPGGAMLQFDLTRLTLNDYRNMKDHYQINVSIAVLMFMMHMVDWHIECEGPDGSGKKIADQIERNLRDKWTGLIRGYGQALWAGYSPMVIDYINNPVTGFIEIDQFKDLAPEDCKVHWDEVQGYAPPGHVPPKFKVFGGIDQLSRTFPIPPENSLWYPLMMENGNYYGKKLLRPAFPSWFFSILMHLFSNRYFERFGEPLPIGRANFNAEYDDGKGNMVSGKNAMETILMNLRNRSVAVLPSDRDPDTKEFEFDIEYLESQMRGADFERYMSRLDEEMSLALFTPQLLFRTSDVGSYNLGLTHMQMFQWSMNMYIGDFAQYVENFPIKRLHDYNWTPNAPKARFVWRQMGKEDADILRQVVEWSLRSNQVKPDATELGNAVGLTFTEVTQVMAPGQEPGGGGGAPAAGAPAVSKPGP